MKKTITMLICVVFLMIASVGCGSGRMINKKYCDTYGLFNKENRCENVQYRTIFGNVFWGILLAETVVAPVYFFGFSLYEPTVGQ